MARLNRLVRTATVLLAVSHICKVQAGPIDEVRQAVRQKDFVSAARELKNLVTFPADSSGSLSEEAIQELAEAQYLLATLYRVGNGVEKNHERAFHGFHAAAKLGHVKAQYALATMYENAWGTERDLHQAGYWYKKSAQSGNKQAARRLEIVNQSMEVVVSDVSTQSMFDALRGDRVNELKKLVLAGHSVNHVNAAGRSLLAEAMVLDAQRCFSFILSQKPALDAVNKQNDHAVMLALRLRKMTYLQALLATGVSPDVLDSAGNSPLIIAVKQSSAEAVGALIRVHASLNVLDKAGYTALDLAALAEKSGIMQLLKNAGAEHGAQFKAMQAARIVQFDNLSLTEQRQQLIDDNPAFSGWPLLHIAAYQNKVELLEYLLDQGESPISVNHDGDSALLVSIKGGSEESYKVLFGSLINKNKQHALFGDLINAAIENKQASIAVWTLSQLTLQERRKFQSNHYLLAACENRLDALADYLVNTIGIKNRVRDSALQQAFFCMLNQNMSLVPVLLHYTPDLKDIRDADGRNALWVAASHNLGALIKNLIAAGVNPEVADNQGVTPLMVASKRGREDTVRLILENHVNIGAIDNNGMTALHHAVIAGVLPIIKQLIMAGASLEVRDKFSRTPLMYASIQGDLTVSRLLVKNGASIRRRDDQGQNAVDIAKAHGYADLVQFYKFQ